MLARLIRAWPAAVRQIVLGVLVLTLLLSGSYAGELQCLAESDSQQRFMSFLVDAGYRVIDTRAFPGPVAHWLAASWSGEILGTVVGEHGDAGDLAFLVEVSTEQIAQNALSEFSREYGEGYVIRQRNLLIYRQEGVSGMPSFLPGGYPINHASIVGVLRERAWQKIDPGSPHNQWMEHTGFFRPFLSIYVISRNFVSYLSAPALWRLGWLRAFLQSAYTLWVVVLLYVSTFFRSNRGRRA